jgi:hypothetical protein
VLAELEKLDEGRGTGTRAGKTRHDPPASAGLTVSHSASARFLHWRECCHRASGIAHPRYRAGPPPMPTMTGDTAGKREPVGTPMSEADATTTPATVKADLGLLVPKLRFGRPWGAVPEPRLPARRPVRAENAGSSAWNRRR